MSPEQFNGLYPVGTPVTIEPRTVQMRNTMYAVRPWGEPGDKPLCSNYGRAALLCGPPVAVVTSHVTAVNRRGRSNRRVQCQMHYDAFFTDAPGPHAIKQAAMDEARDRVIAAHRDEYDAFFTAALERIQGGAS